MSTPSHLTSQSVYHPCPWLSASYTSSDSSVTSEARRRFNRDFACVFVHRWWVSAPVQSREQHRNILHNVAVTTPSSSSVLVFDRSSQHSDHQHQSITFNADLLKLSEACQRLWRLQVTAALIRARKTCFNAMRHIVFQPHALHNIPTISIPRTSLCCFHIGLGISWWLASGMHGMKRRFRVSTNAACPARVLLRA